MKYKRKAAIICRNNLKIYYNNAYDEIVENTESITDSEYDDIYDTDSIYISVETDLRKPKRNAEHVYHSKKEFNSISSAGIQLRKKTYDQSSNISLMKSYFLRYLNFFRKISNEQYWANSILAGLPNKDSLKFAFSKALFPQLEYFQPHFIEEEIMAGLTKVTVENTDNSGISKMLLNPFHNIPVHNKVTGQHGAFINTGSYIKKMVWAPMNPDHHKDQFLAVTMYQNITQRANESDHSSGHMILFYQFSFLMMGTSLMPSPELHMTLVHDWGKLTDMCWSPQPFPIITQSHSLIGHLALVCSDGFVRILPISRQTVTSPIVKVKPNQFIVCLGPSKTVLDDGIYPTCIDWCQYHSDRIAVGYNTGYVAMYILEPAMLKLVSSVRDFNVHIQPSMFCSVFDNAVLSLRISPNNWRKVATTSLLTSHAIIVDITIPHKQVPFNVDTCGIQGAKLLWPDPGDVIVIVGGRLLNCSPGLTLSAIHRPPKKFRMISVPDISVASYNTAFNVLPVGTRSGKLYLVSLNSSDVWKPLGAMSYSGNYVIDTSVKRKFYHQYKIQSLNDNDQSEITDQKRQTSHCKCPSVLFCVHRLLSEFSISISENEDKETVNWQLQPMVNITGIAVNPNPDNCTWLAVSLQCGLIHLVPLTHFYNGKFDELIRGSVNRTLAQKAKQLLDTNLLPSSLKYSICSGRPRKYPIGTKYSSIYKYKKKNDISIMKIKTKIRKHKKIQIVPLQKGPLYVSDNSNDLQDSYNLLSKDGDVHKSVMSSSTCRLSKPKKRPSNITDVFPDENSVTKKSKDDIESTLRKSRESPSLLKPNTSLTENAVASNEFPVNISGKSKSSLKKASHNIKSQNKPVNININKPKVVTSAKKQQLTSIKHRVSPKKIRVDLPKSKVVSTKDVIKYSLKKNSCNNTSVTNILKNVVKLSTASLAEDDQKPVSRKSHKKKEDDESVFRLPTVEIKTIKGNKHITVAAKKNEKTQLNTSNMLRLKNTHASLRADKKSLKKKIMENIQKGLDSNENVEVINILPNSTIKRKTRGSTFFRPADANVEILQKESDKKRFSFEVGNNETIADIIVEKGHITSQHIKKRSVGACRKIKFKDKKDDCLTEVNDIQNKVSTNKIVDISNSSQDVSVIRTRRLSGNILNTDKCSDFASLSTFSKGDSDIILKISNDDSLDGYNNVQNKMNSVINSSSNNRVTRLSRRTVVVSESETDKEISCHKKSKRCNPRDTKSHIIDRGKMINKSQLTNRTRLSSKKRKHSVNKSKQAVSLTDEYLTEVSKSRKNVSPNKTIKISTNNSLKRRINSTTLSGTDSIVKILNQNSPLLNNQGHSISSNNVGRTKLVQSIDVLKKKDQNKRIGTKVIKHDSMKDNSCDIFNSRGKVVPNEDVSKRDPFKVDTGSLVISPQTETSREFSEVFNNNNNTHTVNFVNKYRSKIPTRAVSLKNNRSMKINMKGMCQPEVYKLQNKSNQKMNIEYPMSCVINNRNKEKKLKVKMKKTKYPQQKARPDIIDMQSQPKKVNNQKFLKSDKDNAKTSENAKRVTRDSINLTDIERHVVSSCQKSDQKLCKSTTNKEMNKYNGKNVANKLSDKDTMNGNVSIITRSSTTAHIQNNKIIESPSNRMHPDRSEYHQYLSSDDDKSIDTGTSNICVTQYTTTPDSAIGRLTRSSTIDSIGKICVTPTKTVKKSTKHCNGNPLTIDPILIKNVNNYTTSLKDSTSSTNKSNIKVTTKLNVPLTYDEIQDERLNRESYNISNKKLTKNDNDSRNNGRTDNSDLHSIRNLHNVIKHDSSTITTRSSSRILRGTTQECVITSGSKCNTESLIIDEHLTRNTANKPSMEPLSCNKSISDNYQSQNKTLNSLSFSETEQVIHSGVHNKFDNSSPSNVDSKADNSKRKCIKRLSSNVTVEVPMKKITNDPDKSLDKAVVSNKLNRGLELLEDIDKTPLKRPRTSEFIESMTDNTGLSRNILNDLTKENVERISEKTVEIGCNLSHRGFEKSTIAEPIQISETLSIKSPKGNPKSLVQNRISHDTTMWFKKPNDLFDKRVKHIPKFKLFNTDIDSEIDNEPSTNISISEQNVTPVTFPTFVDSQTICIDNHNNPISSHEHELAKKNDDVHSPKKSITEITSINTSKRDNISSKTDSRPNQVLAKTMMIEPITQGLISTDYSPSYKLIDGNITIIRRVNLSSNQNLKQTNEHITKNKKSDEQSKNSFDDQKVKKLQNIFRTKREELLQSQKAGKSNLSKATWWDNEFEGSVSVHHSNVCDVIDPVIVGDKSHASISQSTLKLNVDQGLEKIKKILDKGIEQTPTVARGNRSPTLLHPFSSLKLNKSPTK